MQYPKTRKEDVREIYFGREVEDPYRWLEDDHADETQAWVSAQQKVTDGILSEYPDRKKVFEEIIDLIDYPKQSLPVKRGKWYYYSKNSGTQNQWVVYRKRELDGEEELFFDPNTLSEDGTTRAYRLGVSKDRRYFFYNISQAGADDSEIWIYDTETKTFLEEKLLNARHTDTAWYKDGYIYSQYDEIADNLKANKNQRVFYHKLGDSFENDVLLYEDPENPFRYHHGWVSDDEKYMFIYVSEGTSNNRFYIKIYP